MNLFRLVGELVLDTSNYDKGIKDATKQNEEFAENTGKNALVAAGKWALVGGAILKVASTIKGLIIDSTQYSDNIKNMAQIYGYSVREIQEMQSVAEQSGKSLERVLRGIRSSGQTAAEYLGLSTEEYAAMVDEAYRFGTILSEDAINNVDALGDRIQYLKSEWTAAITALLANEDGAEQAVDAFFENVGGIVDDYAPAIVRFFVRLLLKVAQGLLKVAPQIIGDFIDAVIDTVLSINWIDVGFKIIKAILQGIWRGLGRIGKKIFGIEDKGETAFGEEEPLLSSPRIGAGDYRVEESVNHKIDVNLKFDGDTPIGEENAQLVGENLAQQIDEILGRRLNG